MELCRYLCALFCLTAESRTLRGAERRDHLCSCWLYCSSKNKEMKRMRYQYAACSDLWVNTLWNTDSWVWVRFGVAFVSESVKSHLYCVRYNDCCGCNKPVETTSRFHCTWHHSALWWESNSPVGSLIFHLLVAISTERSQPSKIGFPFKTKSVTIYLNQIKATHISFWSRQPTIKKLAA